MRLTRIYTRAGDAGQTSLGDGSRVSKTDPRIQAYGAVDEVNSLLGLALATPELPEEFRPWLQQVQNDLFDVGADLCTPLQATYEYPPLRVQQVWIDELEADCDRYLGELEKLRSFILPGGTPGSAYLHVATTVARRAERQAWAAIAAYGDQPGTTRGEGGINVLTAKYLNRLSDLLFVLARVANLPIGGDVLWQPGGGREQAPDTKKAAASDAGPGSAGA